MGSRKVPLNRNVLARVEKIADSGLWGERRPRWYNALKKFPPLSDRPFARETPLKTVTFAEDRLRKAYQRSVPGAALEVKHSTAAPSPSQRFVAAQVELMDKEGLSEEEAFVAARVQLSKETRAKNVMRAIAREQALADGIPMGKNLLER